MHSNLKFFNKSKTLPTDIFFKNVLYNKSFGYYSTKLPFGKNGDFITAPKISKLFSEMISIWLVSTWERFGKPKNLNIIELGPGDGSLMKILIEVLKNFPEANNSINLYLYEKSNFLKKIQKKNIIRKKIRWINSFKQIKKGPVIFFGNEFFDAIPIKQFKREGKYLYEKFYSVDKNNSIVEIYKRANKKSLNLIKSYKTLKNLKFFEFPELGLKVMEKIIEKISSASGCILLIDYGYLRPASKSTLQSVMKHKKNDLLNNLGKADITSHVNFRLLNEFFKKKNLKVQKVVSQKFFLERMGIINRANLLSKKMNFRDQSKLFLRLKRLIDPDQMGELFKVVIGYKFKPVKFLGFN